MTEEQIKANRQAAFDKAYKGVMDQGMKASGEVSCQYYMEVDGKVCRCNVGHIVSLEKAQELQALYPQSGVEAFEGEDKGLAEFYGGMYFLSALQGAHDSPGAGDPNYLDEYHRNMAQVAQDFDLSTEIFNG